MTWYAAHIVIRVRFLRTKKRRQIAFENVVLIKAQNGEEAWDKAEAIASVENNLLETGAFEWEGEPTEWEFVGIRKVVETLCSSRFPQHGDELSYSELRFDSLDALKQFAQGRSAPLNAMDENRLSRRNQSQLRKQ